MTTLEFKNCFLDALILGLKLITIAEKKEFLDIAPNSDINSVIKALDPQIRSKILENCLDQNSTSIFTYIIELCDKLNEEVESGKILLSEYLQREYSFFREKYKVIKSEVENLGASINGQREGSMVENLTKISQKEGNIVAILGALHVKSVADAFSINVKNKDGIKTCVAICTPINFNKFAKRHALV